VQNRKVVQLTLLITSNRSCSDAVLQNILKMDQVVEIVNLIKDDTIEVRLHRLPSYIQPFVSQPIDEDIVLVYKKLVGYVWCN
jgi:mRNA-degrading endonuclease YafQ of YafQ-DinJ toxin-antitoxin module